MRRLQFAFTVLIVVGCGGNPLPPIDATVDSPPEPACTGAVYDPCTDTTASTDCMTGPPGAPMCKAFTGSGFTVCTQTCTVTADCPLQDGSATFCNPKGICKPGMPNACMR